MSLNKNYYTVDIKRDAEAGRWYVYHSDIPGLTAESDHYDELKRVILELAPILIKENHPDMISDEFPVFLHHGELENARLSA